MKTLIRRYFCLVLVLLLVWGCSEKWNGVDPNAVGDFEIKGLTLDNFPFKADLQVALYPQGKGYHRRERIYIHKVIL
ncbi:MAG: hypothetical protein IJK19_05405 [Bacteroidales bacterium]|nr:hypothetical protein [Bacteroidales bacterium]